MTGQAGAMGALALLAADRDWTEIPAIRLLGAVLGTLLIIAAIRAISGRR